MSRPTVKQLVAEVESLRAEVAELRELFHAPPVVQLVREVTPPAKLDGAVDFTKVWCGISADYAAWNEAEGWGYNAYI